MDETLVTLFEQSVQSNKDKTAIIFDDGHKIYISYKDVLKQSCQVGNILKTYSISHECVGVFGDMAVDTVPVLIGIMKLGCCFCPLHSDWPKKYLKNVVSKLGIRAFVARNAVESRISDLLDSHFTQYPVPSSDGVSLLVTCDAIQSKLLHSFAYCITTTGTTGDPKIVRVPHQCIVPNISSIRKIYELTPEDIVCQVSPLTFDPSIVEIFSTLSVGATLLMTPDILKKIPRIFAATVQTNSATVLQGTPIFLQSLGLNNLLGENSSLRILSFGGEACPSPCEIMLNRHPKNGTRLFNLYGITEVSSWATCCTITNFHLNGSCENIPLGPAMEDTILEIRNEKNEIIKQGTGFLFIGGSKRQCLINDEEKFLEKVMRNSGDLVKSDERGNMYYVGRSDDQIKRHGKRISLLVLEQISSKAESVFQSAAIVSPDNKLYLIVTTVEKHPTQNIITDVFATISKYLPPYFKPDDVLIYETNLPYNRHGKIDKKKLLQYAMDARTNGKSRRMCESFADILIDEWRAILNMPQDADISYECRFLELGGDSFSALQLLDRMETYCDRSLPNFLDILLSGTFGQLKEYVNSLSGKRKHEAETAGCTVSNKIHKNVADVQNQNSKCEVALCNQCQITPWDKDNVLSLRRCGRTQLYGKNLHETFLSIVSNSKWLTQSETSENDSLNLKLAWTYNLGKCIDASPLVVQDSNSCVVYMGSHSHTFAAVSVNNGHVLWKTTLGDRIESSAVLSKCTNYVIVGCYNGKLYVLDRRNGETDWTFDTQGQIKCSPEVDPVTGIVYTGSHSHSVYGLDLQQRRALWCQKEVGGSIYSSPLLWQDPHHLYVASLSCRLLCLNPNSGEVIWGQELFKPIFSSPAADINQVVVGCVDGSLNSFSHTGEKLWLFRTDAPIFSSPSFSSSGNILCGSHDHNLYCLSNSGQFVWKYKTNSPVFSSPYVINICDIHRHKPTNAVVFCDTMSTLYINDLINGSVLVKVSLPGEIFSSPVSLNDKIVVGCRNDEIYCFSLERVNETAI